MDINYELYKVFYFVAKTLSFSEASKCLYISQSAVSQSVKVLEKKLGQTLFIRSTKRVQLTPEGEILFKHIEPAMNLIHKGETQLLEANTLNGGQLRIAASDTICRYFLVPYLNKFHKLYPNVHIKVTNSTSIDCARILENGQVDFIITNYPNSGLLNTHSVRAIREFRDVFVASADHFPLRDKTFTLAELLDYPIMMLDRIGLGIAVVPDFCIPKDEKQLFILKLSETLPVRQLVVVHNENLPVSQAAKQFMDML